MSGKDEKLNAKKIDIAGTICARDYKGPNNYGFNGVIEDVWFLWKFICRKSDRFSTSILGGGVARTIMTGGESAVILGYIENGTGRHQSNTAYSTDGLSPSPTTIDGGGTQQIKILVGDNNEWHKVKLFRTNG